MQTLGIDRGFWRGRRVFVTGHTGFVGGWLCVWLDRLGAEVCGYALAPPTRPSFFEAVGLGETVGSIQGDIRDGDRLRAAIAAFGPEIVLHLAAQPLVRRAHASPIESFSVNVMGTANLMQALREVPSLRAALIYTTDKVYDNREALRGYREGDRLGGNEAYGGSKACAEIVVSSFRRAFLGRVPGRAPVGVASVRAGNIIGGGDWAAERLVPDAVRAFGAGRPLAIRNPRALRPWQHVLDPLRGTLLLAQALYNAPESYSGAWNLGPTETEARRVADLADALTRLWGGRAAWMHVAEPGAPAEARLLALNSAKAAECLGWRTLWPLDRALAACVDWYRAHLSGADMVAVTARQIAAFEGAN